MTLFLSNREHSTCFPEPENRFREKLNNLIPEHIVEEVRSRSEIVEIVSEFVLLKKSGKNYKGLCPFHSEKTASFTVSTDKQIYHCFGCGSGGNVFKFLMAQEEISFVEAVRKLAERAHIEIPSNVRRGMEQVPRGERDSLIKTNQTAADYFTSLLKDPEGGQEARQYIETRKFDAETVARFQLGWASPAWRDLMLGLERKAKISRSDLESAGLIIKKEGGGPNDYYDRFRERLIIPLKDMHGNIIGFAGRVIKEGNPKYLNSPETPLYKKGNHLYGLDLARDEIRKNDQAIIVEGYFDQIRAFQFGIKNVVATCGTALTPAQARLLKNRTSNVVMVFDSDPAGQAAAVRGFDTLLEQGMTVRTVTLPEGQDPDSFILSEGPDAFIKQIQNARLFIESYIQNAVQTGNLDDPQGRAQVVNQVLPLLSKLKNSVERSEWIKYLSEMAGVEDKALLAELNRALTQKRPAVPGLPHQDGVYGDKQNPELYLIQILLNDKNLAEMIRDQISVEEFNDPNLRHILETAFALLQEGREAKTDWVLDRLEHAEARAALTRLSLDTIPFENMARTTEDCIHEIKKRDIETRKNELKKQRNNAIQSGELDRCREIENQLREIQLSLTAG